MRGGAARQAGSPRVDAILMASGFSRRFGARNKLLLPFRGAPLAAHTLHLACGIAQLGRVLFVVADDDVAALATGTRTEVIPNAHPEYGQRESIHLGVQASRADYYLFFPCDQPLLDEATVLAVLEKAQPGVIAVPAHGGRPGNPVLFSAAYRDELLHLPEGAHARDVKRRHPQAVVEVPIPSPLPLADVDSTEDLKKLEL